ncbi:MAG: hypothetical protein MPJ50_16865 [Pirellulales bacterium]|nr:hypothetical protein [Pirellulales bacterium]
MDAPQQRTPPIAFAKPSFANARWQMRPGWDGLSVAKDNGQLSHLLHAGEGRIVKDGSHRTVYRFDTPHAALYVKHYRCRGLLRRLRHFFRASSARREWTKSLRLISLDIPTAAPVALGEVSSHGLVGDSFLVTRAIEPSLTLDEAMADGFLASGNPAAARLQQQTTRHLARLTAALHQAGVAPDDFHGGNVLVQLEGSEWDCGQAQQAAPDLRLHLIDVPGIHIGSGPLSWHKARANLVMLTSGFMNRTTSAQRWRFWREYLRCRGAAWDAKTHSTWIYAAARSFARRLVRGRDARSLRDNRDFRAVVGNGWRAYTVRNLLPESVEQLASRPIEILRRFQHAPEKIAAGSLVIRADLPTEDGKIVVALKRLRPMRWLDRFVNTVLGQTVRSKAIRNWRVGHALLQRGIPTARPICCLSTKSEEFLATEWLHGAENLHLFAWRIAELPTQERDELAIRAAVALGQTIGRLHWWRIRHRDLKGCNLLLTQTSSTMCEGDEKESPQSMRGCQVTASIVDLDGVRILRRLPYGARVRDLARLAVSASAHRWIGAGVREAFLSAYIKASKPDRFDEPQLKRSVATRAEKMVAHMRRQGKLIA